MLLQRLAVTTCFATKDNEGAAKAAVTDASADNVDNPMLTAEMTASIEKLGEEKPSAHPKIVSFGGRRPRGHPPAHYTVKATDAKINVVIALRVEPQRVFGKHCLALFFSPLLPPLFFFC